MEKNSKWDSGSQIVSIVSYTILYVYKGYGFSSLLTSFLYSLPWITNKVETTISYEFYYTNFEHLN